MAVNQELHEFLLEVEDNLRIIGQAIADTRRESAEWALLQAELLFQDAVIVDELIPNSNGEVLVQANVSVLQAVQQIADDHRRQRMRGRPQVPIAEEQLATLL